MKIVNTKSMFYVYFLKSLKDGKLYLGVTGNLQRRFAEHNSGQNRSTKSRMPLKLIYYEAFVSKSDALRREKSLKLFKKAYSELKRRISDSIGRI